MRWSKASTGRLDPIKKVDAPGPGKYYDERVDRARHAYEPGWFFYEGGMMSFKHKGWSFGKRFRQLNKVGGPVGGYNIRNAWLKSSRNKTAPIYSIGTAKRSSMAVNNGVPGPAQYNMSNFYNLSRYRQHKGFSFGKAKRF